MIGRGPCGWDRMLARKLLWTALLVLTYVLVAVGCDFAFNTLVVHSLRDFTPVETAFLAVLIGAPTTYYLIGQRFDLRRAIAERDQTDEDLRRKTEDLQQSEQKLRALFELAPVAFESTPGVGSTFWFEVPAPLAADDQVEMSAEQPVHADLGPMSILVVDDVAVNRELVSAMLSPFDATLFEAASGPEAVSAAMERRFDVILMDLQMPGMDGMAAARAIRANSDLNRATPILALSANVLPEQITACKAAGMNDHIAKPIYLADLLGKIAYWSSDVQPTEGLSRQA